MAQRGSDARDAMAEMAERAQQISQEAGTKIAAAMKDVIGAAAGIAGFAVESARDLVQYMVRRGQITQDEAEKLIRQAEDAHSRQARSAGGAGAGAKAASDRSLPKAERPSREVAREETKPAASAAKRASGATAAAKPEKKTPAKRPGGAKKSAAKPSAPKKKR
jgi:polyhydroxyalkanoate synthesis regulator phasin